MRNRVLLSSLALISLFLIVSVQKTSAAPSKNPIFATIQFVEDKFQELLNTLNEHEQNNQTDFDLINQRADDLDERLEYLEFLLTPTPTPIPTTFVLVDSLQAPAVTNFDPPNEYESITLKVSSTSSVVGWAPAVSFDGGNSYFEQVRVICGETNCPEVTIPLLDTDYYRFQTGSSTGLVSAEATYNDESDSKVLTLGGFVNYPFTSSPFNTDGYSTITITVGGGDNPQHLTGISLQRSEGGTFVQKEFAACDGGAVCPITEFPLLGGDYQLQLQGSGTKAVMGAILRK